MDDVRLVQQAVGGSGDAFGAIFDGYAGRVHDFLWWVMGDEDWATEGVVATFRIAGERIHELENPALLGPWLFAIARHEAVRLIPATRRAAAPVDLGDPDDLRSDGSPGSRRVGLARILGGAAAGLSLDERSVLDLAVRQGLHGPELAAALGLDPQDAVVAEGRARQAVSALLGDLAVAVEGPEECAAADELLARFDGLLDASWRQRIARHADGCAVCDGLRRSRLGATALMAAAPSMGLPTEARARVLDSIALASHHGRPWPGHPGGFPAELEAGQGTRWRWPVVAAAAAAVVVAGIIALASGNGDGGDQIVAGPQTSLAAPTTSPATTTTSTAVPTTGETTGPGSTPATLRTITTRAATPGTTTATTRPATTTSTPRPPTTQPAPTSTRPADTTGPSIRISGISPNAIKADPACPAEVPTQATVTAEVSDPSGVSAVTVQVAPGQGPAPMVAAGGGVYSAVVGPISGVPTTLDAAVIVHATDGAGNINALTASLTLRCGNPA